MDRFYGKCPHLCEIREVPFLEPDSQIVAITCPRMPFGRKVVAKGEVAHEEAHAKRRFHLYQVSDRFRLKTSSGLAVYRKC